MTSLSLFLILAGIVSAADWPEWRGPTHNGTASQVFVASPAIVDGEIFLRGSSTLFCISARAPAAGQ